MMNQNNPFEMVCLNCINDPSDSTCRHCKSIYKIAKIKGDILHRVRQQDYSTYVYDVTHTLIIPASSSIDHIEASINSLKHLTPNLY